MPRKATSPAAPGCRAARCARFAALYPVLFQYGGLTLRSYGALLALSFLVGIWVAHARAPRHGIDPHRLLDVYVLIVIAALVGSRLLYVAEHAAEYVKDPWQLLRLRQGGLSMYGGVILAAFAAAVYCRRTAVPFASVADACAPSLALGEGLTRIGCFLNGCCFGTPSTLPWAMVFPGYSSAGKVFAGVAIHPTQLYASLAHFMIFAALLAAGSRIARPGYLIGLFLVLHAAARLGVEALRYQAPSALQMSFAGVALTPSRLVCVGLFALGAYVLLVSRSRTPENVEP